MKHLARLTLAMLVLTSVGCVPSAGVKPIDLEQAWSQHRAKMLSIDAWNLKGKMAVKTGRKGSNLTMLWKYQRDHQKIELYGPFGSGRVQIDVRPGRATLKDTQGEITKGANATEALQERLDWQVPFEELRYWIRGIPYKSASAIDAPAITLDNTGRLQVLRQGNWRVEYFDYTRVGELELPLKLTIAALPGTMQIYSNEGEYIGDQVSVKVILKNWSEVEYE